MVFAPAFPAVFRPVFDPGGAVAVAADWWEVAGKTCVFAYQPKGAASLAASYSNLANPGTYDAAPGEAPSWAAGTGWTFNGTSQHLLVSYTFSTQANLSILMQFSGVSAGSFTGAYYPTAYVSFYQYWGENSAYGNGNSVTVAAIQASGNMAVAGGYGYFDGSQVCEIAEQDYYMKFITTYCIGALRRDSDGLIPLYWAGNIQALVAYSGTLTAGEVATKAAAMAAL